jgi:hypothetical protein
MPWTDQTELRDDLLDIGSALSKLVSSVQNDK